MEYLWGEFSVKLDGWTLTRDHLPLGVWGLTRFESKEIIIAVDLYEVEARCTLAHEIAHALHGPVPEGCRAREETRASQAAARMLLSDLGAIAKALTWAGWDYSMTADDLYVDEDTLRCRLRTLTSGELFVMASLIEEGAA